MSPSTAVRLAVAATVPAAVLVLAVPRAAAADVPTCRTADVTVTLGSVEAGAGQRYAPLTVTAHPGVTCRLTGYATGLAFTAADGSALPTDPHRYPQDHVPAVVLGPTAAAAFDLHWAGVPVAEGDDPGQAAPAALTVTLPGTTDPVTVTWTGGPTFDHGYVQHKPAAVRR
ncbi:DUF4232 domain-containing protein [Actinocatenispora rupis]|uniref:DUF4232 domain-containing protein n=1 Tax=Actinocatenispora rupis TaxID=519421 RepID=A0A8J3J608_9ACTN|nr:DUF4232 domain-containing protein [Actinocatenispora rupis]GID15435.1 hypothetical protein Aru02nite_63240 [Actinocatenispora rupis]